MLTHLSRHREVFSRWPGGSASWAFGSLAHCRPVLLLWTPSDSAPWHHGECRGGKGKHQPERASSHCGLPPQGGLLPASTYQKLHAQCSTMICQ